jgi:hypothetical protein
VLWLGDVSVVPGDPREVDGIGWSVTRDGAGDVRAQWAPSATDATDVVGEAIALTAAGRTAHLGHLVAPAGVRFVAVVERAAPGHDPAIPVPPELASGLGEQVDLALVQSEPGIRLYESSAWGAVRAVVDPAALPADPTDPIDASLRAQLAGSTPVVGPLGGSAPAGPGTLMYGESENAGWHARSGGAAAPRADGVGWTNSFELDARGSVALGFTGGAWRWLFVVQALLWGGLAVTAVRLRRPRASRGEVANGGRIAPAEAGA